jgi:hypothetical protein
LQIHGCFIYFVRWMSFYLRKLFNSSMKWWLFFRCSGDDSLILVAVLFKLGTMSLSTFVLMVTAPMNLSASKPLGLRRVVMISPPSTLFLWLLTQRTSVVGLLQVEWVSQQLRCVPTAHHPCGRTCRIITCHSLESHPSALSKQVLFSTWTKT